MDDRDDELLKVKIYLAEVLDECVFHERQRRCLEKRYATHLEECAGYHQKYVQCIKDLCFYASLLEDHIVTPCVDVLERSAAGGELGKMRAARAAMTRSLHAAVPNTSLGVVDPPFPTEGTKSPHLAGLSVQDARDTVCRFLSMKASFQSTLIEVESLLNQEVDRLHRFRTLDELERETTPPSRERDDGTKMALVPQDDGGTVIEAKFRAYEMTIAALNTEVATLHKQMTATTNSCTAEVGRLKEEMQRQAVQHAAVVDECDVALHRLSLELESLILENAEMKKRLSTR
ncbi:hypothetical protein ADEAN_000396300 [Angomonas deanei]|uniref:Uncharacterized protein n=1 Tax=Angomonas deanei TaxID=59799 RepID=A0A7G2CBV1_9TRYP|nr:hypothetical protein ADEAN_000396300 [Angomonas deanei]